ncbi:MAG: hypothetical protein ACXAD7_08850 [Candidatus Kariarchaeaceae archaeon]|jgi:hypothetical protein
MNSIQSPAPNQGKPNRWLNYRNFTLFVYFLFVSALALSILSSWFYEDQTDDDIFTQAMFIPLASFIWLSLVWMIWSLIKIGKWKFGDKDQIFLSHDGTPKLTYKNISTLTLSSILLFILCAVLSSLIFGADSDTDILYYVASIFLVSFIITGPAWSIWTLGKILKRFNSSQPVLQEVQYTAVNPPDQMAAQPLVNPTYEIKSQEHIKTEANSCQSCGSIIISNFCTICGTEAESATKLGLAKTSMRILLKQLQPNIPISLHRLSELAKLSSQEVEKVIISVLSEDPTLGQYLHLEQVFIKDASGRQTTISEGSSTMVDTLQTCPRCKETLSVLVRKCTNCQEDLAFCNICKRGFTASDQIVDCPECENRFHRAHLLGYIQSQGSCPVCKNSLVMNQFE